MIEQSAQIIDSIHPQKFKNPFVTAKGEQRAVVALTRLKTLWFNTGSLCNITCRNCYMDSSPTNDALAYLSLSDVTGYLDEIKEQSFPVEEIAFTGGEPFMNRSLPDMLHAVLDRGFKALVLTNAMKPLQQKQKYLDALNQQFPGGLTIRVSIDHFTQTKHEDIRGTNTWQPMINGLRWLVDNNFKLAIAGRMCWDETEHQARQGYAKLFAQENIDIDTTNPAQLVLFPEMDAAKDVPEITVSCWDILGVAPETMMCATSRMVVKKRGSDHPVVMPCTLLPYDEAFELGRDLQCSQPKVQLNHPHCARFCVLGGASCSAA